MNPVLNMSQIIALVVIGEPLRFSSSDIELEDDSIDLEFAEPETDDPGDPRETP